VSYSIFILRSAQRELGGLSRDAYERVRDAIRALAQDPRPSGYLKLAARRGYRIRIGDYRVIYEIDEEKKIITVLHIGHWRDIYR
jgi:mRNA interferase RelE/StbE